MIQIRCFNAGAGESFHLYFPEEKFNILIDGGFFKTYDNEIKDSLLEIKDRGEVLDLLIVTHMCKDHINGIIKLIKENSSNSESKIIQIKEVWFNSYFNSNSKKIKITLPKEIEKKINRIFPYYMGEEYIGDIGINQLKDLGNLILEGKYNVNMEPLQVDTVKNLNRKGIMFKFLSPTQETLKELETNFSSVIGEYEKDLCDKYSESLVGFFERYISSLNEEPEEHRGNISNSSIEDLARSESDEDDSLSNKGSLAFVIEYRGKKLMFLGDSYQRIYLKSLKEHYSNLEEVEFDLIKLSHHGSKHNNHSNFFELIRARNFLIATDGSGKHEHPDKETIAKLIIDHQNESKIILNCKNESHNRWLRRLKDNKELKEKYNYIIEIRNYLEI